MSDREVPQGPGQSSPERRTSRQRRESDYNRPNAETVKTTSSRMSYVQEPHLESLPEQVRRESRRVSDYHRVSQIGIPGVAMSQRRTSNWMYRRPSVASSQRMTTNSDPAGMPRTQYENTYKMIPDDEQRFRPRVVEQILAEILHSFLDGEQYDPKKCAQLSKHISDLTKKRVKDLGFVRHKLVCHVVIGQAGGQSIRCGSRCIWDRETDGHATATFQNTSLFATATVFAVYFE